MDADTLKFIIPVSTFIPGSVLTLFLKSLKQPRTTLKHSVSTMRHLTNEWFNQLHEIFGRGESNVDPALADSFTRYLANRIFLPELLMHIEILIGKKGCESFLIEVLKFINIVATHKGGISSGYSDDHPSPSWACANPLSSQRTLTHSQVLKELDFIVQRISVEAGALIK